MKKSLAAIFSLLILSAVFSLTGCLADAVADDGSGYPASGSGSGSGGSGGTGKGWALCKDSSYDIFDLQVWKNDGNGAGEFKHENQSDCGRFTSTKLVGGWFGGGLVSSDSSKYIDFTGVSKMTFEIRGTIPPKAICITVQGKDKTTSAEHLLPQKKSLSVTAGLTELSETEWQRVTFDVSGAAKDNVINAFCIIVAGDLDGPYIPNLFKENDYFEIRNLDWVDSDGKSVKLSLK